MARTTTRSGKREMNPTDAYRKLQRKKEVSKNKKERKKVREFSAMVRNPDLMVEEVRRMEVLDGAGKLSENDQKRLANLRVTHRVLLKKKKAQEDAVRKQTEEEEAAKKMSQQDRMDDGGEENEGGEGGDGSDPSLPPPPPLPPGPPPMAAAAAAGGSSAAGFGMHPPPPPPGVPGMYGVAGAPVPGMPGMLYPPPPPPRGPPPPPPRSGAGGTQTLPPPPPPRRAQMPAGAPAVAPAPMGVYGPGQASSGGGEAGRAKGRARGGGGGGARGGVVDPLDPEGEGYTERPYNLGKQQGPQQQRPDPPGMYGPAQGPEPNQSLSENFAAMTTGSDDGDRAGSGTLGPVQGPARPAGLRGSAAAVSEDVLRMKPTHLRVHRPSGPRGTPAATAAAAAARAGFGGAVGARGRVSTSEKVPFSVPRPAGSTFLTPRSARAGAGVSSSRAPPAGAPSSVPRPATAMFLKPAAAAAPSAAGAAGGPRAGPRRTAKQPAETKKAGVNQEYDSFMEEMKSLGAF